MVRNPDRVPALREQGVELRTADLLNRDQLIHAFRGADAVVSNAGLFSIVNFDWRQHHEVNILGTRNVFEAIEAAGIKRVVQVSSVAVYEGHTQPRVTEDHPQFTEQSRPGWTNAYRISKALSEQLAWHLAAQYHLELTVVRPCAIFGAFDPNFTPLFKTLARFPITIVPAPLRVGFVYAGDVAEAIALAFETPVSIGKAYNVTGDDHAFPDFIRAWEEAGGASSFFKIPLPVVPYVQVYDNTRAQHDLGWHNRPLVDAFRETIALEAEDKARSSGRSTDPAHS